MALHTVDEAFDKKLLAGSSCAIGVFDGLHVGHRYLISQAAGTSGAGERAIVVTFDIDPDEVFHPDRLRKIMRNADRLAALDATGADEVVVLPFDERLYTKSPSDFLECLFGGFAPRHIHVGEDFRFGAKAVGDFDTLQAWGEKAGCSVHGHRLVSADGLPITATRIRKLLGNCNVADAKKLLGRPYRLCETVRKGRGEGAGFGFATANLHTDPRHSVLGEGVYAAYAEIGGVRYKAAVSVGVSPTFEATSTANVEVHVLDFADDLVGCEIAVDFVEFLRPMVKFESAEQLIETVMGNISWVRENL